MRRLRLTIPVLVAILLTGMLLLPATTQGAPIPYYESIGVAADVHESGDVFFDEARNGVLLGHQPIVAKAQDSGDKPIYAQLIERVAAFAKQLLDKVPTGITSAFTGPDWMRNVAPGFDKLRRTVGNTLETQGTILAQNQLSNIERARNPTSKRPAGSGGIRAGKPQSRPRDVPGGAD